MSMIGEEAIKLEKGHNDRIPQVLSIFPVIRSIGYVPVWDGYVVIFAFLQIGNRSVFYSILKQWQVIV